MINAVDISSARMDFVLWDEPQFVLIPIHMYSNKELTEDRHGGKKEKTRWSGVGPRAIVPKSHHNPWAELTVESYPSCLCLDHPHDCCESPETYELGC